MAGASLLWEAQGEGFLQAMASSFYGGWRGQDRRPAVGQKIQTEKGEASGEVDTAGIRSGVTSGFGIVYHGYHVSWASWVWYHVSWVSDIMGIMGLVSRAFSI